MMVSGEGLLRIGEKTKISENVEIIFHNPLSSLVIGDYCYLAPGVRIIISDGNVKIDDWSRIHNDCLLLCERGLDIGEHCWFGQNSIIDGTGGLTIKNNVRVGMYSQIWSHVGAGEQFEGCTLKSENPVQIEDEVWLVGSCIVSSGVSVGRRTIALIGSNITKSVGSEVVVAGSPAQVKSGLNFYEKISFLEKVELLHAWLAEFKDVQCPQAVIERTNEIIVFRFSKSEAVLFFLNSDLYLTYLGKKKVHETCVDLPKKKYTKSLSLLEEKLFKFLSDNKVRFLRED